MKNSEIITKLALDPILFVETMLGAKPQKWQRKVLEDLLIHDKISIKSGHGTGKSALLSWLIIYWLSTKIPCKVAVTANTARQLNDVLWLNVTSGIVICLMDLGTYLNLNQTR